MNIFESIMKQSADIKAESLKLKVSKDYDWYKAPDDPDHHRESVEEFRSDDGVVLGRVFVSTMNEDRTYAYAYAWNDGSNKFTTVYDSDYNSIKSIDEAKKAVEDIWERRLKDRYGDEFVFTESKKSSSKSMKLKESNNFGDFREFTQNDWYGFQGAERFDDGSEPLLYEDDLIIIIVDNQGMELDVFTDEYSGYAWIVDTKPGDKERKIRKGQRLVNMFRGLDSEKAIELANDLFGDHDAEY